MGSQKRMTTPIGALPLFAHAEKQHRTVAPPPTRNPYSTAADVPPEADALRAALTACVGRANAMTATQLAAAAGLWPECTPADRGTKARQVMRTWYEHMARPGYVLIALSSGFYYTSDPEDLSRYDATMQSRIRNTAETLRRTRLQARTCIPTFTHHGRGRWSAEKEVMPDSR